MRQMSILDTFKDILDGCAVINPMNKDQQGFKWAILTKHVKGKQKHIIGENYKLHENKYNFSDVLFPTPIYTI